MLLEALKFEWRYYHARHLLGPGALIFFLLGFAMTGRIGSGAESLLNAPYALIPIYQQLTLAAVVVTAVFTGIAVLRDSRHQCDALVFTTGVGKNRLLSVRFLGLISVSFAALACAAPGMMLRALMPYGLHGSFAANDPFVHGRILLTVVLPNILLIAVLLFAVALRTRNGAATYVAGLAFYVLYLLCAAFAGSPLVSDDFETASATFRFWVALCDPLGTLPFFEQTADWTRAQRDGAFPAWDSLMVGNRLLWTAVTVLIGVFAWRSDPFRPTSRGFLGRARRKGRRPVRPRLGEAARVLPVQPRFGTRQHLAAWLSCLRLDGVYLIKSLPFWVVAGLWAALLLGEIAPLAQSHPFHAARLPLTASILERFQFDLLPGYGLFVILFYSGELVQRARTHHMQPLLATTPSSDVVFFFAKLGSLCLIPVVLISIAVVIGVAFQISLGWTRFDWTLYGSLYLYGGVPLCLSAVLCLVVHRLCPNPYLALLIAAGLLVFFRFGLCAAVGWEHPLWRYGAFPGYRYSDMSGYGYMAAAFWRYLAYWVALAVAVLVPISVLERRGHGESWLRRLRVLPSQLKPRERWLIAVCLLLCALLGGDIFYETNGVGTYRSTKEREAGRVGYERHFRRFHGQNHPVLKAVKTEMAIYPREGRYVLQAEYRLANPHTEALSEFLLTMNPDLDLRELRLEGAVFQTEGDAPGAAVVRLVSPMQPGETRLMTFAVHHRTTAFSTLGGRHQVAPNGTMIHSLTYFPTLGYIADHELSDPARREVLGLGERIPPKNATLADDGCGDGDFITFETLVSTSEDQIAVAPGRLIKQGVEGGRAWFHYRSDGPVRDGIPYLSAQYATQEQTIEGIDVTLLYHPDHAANLTSIWEGIRATLRYGNQWFGPLPHRQLRLAEVPDTTGISGYAAPGLILMGEFSGFTDRLSGTNRINPVFRRTAHETAHQWWGHHVAPTAADEGAMLLVETLAKYTELMLLAQTAGPANTQQFVDHEVGRYFRARVKEPKREQPLSRVRWDQRYVMYAKGAAAVNALRHRIGEAPLNGALRRLVVDHGHPNPPATAQDLMRLLVAAAPDHAAFIHEWFEKVVFYRSQLEQVTLTPLLGGEVLVEVAIHLEKFEQDHDGRDQETAFHQDVSWSVTFDKGEGNQTITRSFPMKNGRNRVQWTLPGSPTQITFDPYRQLLDAQRGETDRALARHLAD